MNFRLLQLASPALPVGAYSYSQGLEAAVESGIVSDAASAGRWIGDVLELAVAPMEAPIFLRLAAAWIASDGDEVVRWNTELVASRETAELRAETLQMGHSLRSLLRDLDVAHIERLDAIDAPGFPTVFTFAVAAWRIDVRDALSAYLFAWIENQVMAAVKAVPLGQTDGQRMLGALGQRIAAIVEAAAAARDEDLCNFAPGLALACARHETQYSRLFRS